MPEKRLNIPYFRELSSWVNIGWLVALIVGLWGVMIGLGKFGLSEFMFLFCGAIAIARLIYEAVTDRTRTRIIVCMFFFVAIIVIEYYTLRWTNGLAVEARAQEQRLSKLDQIPTLTSQLQEMQEQQKIDRATSKQQMDDFGQTNKDLKSSIEEKDAKLAAIAKEQLDLNYSPEVLVTSNDTKDNIFITNNGKTNVVLYELEMDGTEISDVKIPETIVPTASERFTAQDKAKETVLMRAQQQNTAQISFDGTAYLRTENKKKYSLGFTVTYEIKDGAITKMFVTDHAINDITLKRQ
jgi:hypothetical protein